MPMKGWENFRAGIANQLASRIKIFLVETAFQVR